MEQRKEFNKNQTLVFNTKPVAFEAMGEKLIRVTCYLLGTGINRNYSNITKEAIIKANAKLPHLPVIGHLIKDEQGGYYLGGHDVKVEDKGHDWDIVPLTVPLGCIAGDKEFEFVEITEEDTGTTREYLKVDMILWNHMSSIMEAAYSREVYFNHSIEIDDVEGDWDETNNFRIDSFKYHAPAFLALMIIDGRISMLSHVSLKVKFILHIQKIEILTSSFHYCLKKLKNIVRHHLMKAQCRKKLKIILLKRRVSKWAIFYFLIYATRFQSY